MKIQHNISLKPYNTFGIDSMAKHFVSINSVKELQQLLDDHSYPEKFILGGGSNMLMAKDIDTLVVHVNIKGIEKVSETASEVIITAKAGENWHQFVLWCLEQDYGGLENMSLIPGNVGTAPIQNIGAYGIELKDVFQSCEAIEISSNTLKTFDREDCKFGYRNSIFKNEAKGKYIITSVTFRLTKNNHKLNTSYGAIETELAEMGIDVPKIKDISNAVIAIRQRKLPDPAILGNSGSFFKNPIIKKEAFAVLQQKYPDIPHYVVSNDEIKVPAGWLIEEAGFKGKRFGDAGVHKNQALVLVNHGNATGSELWGLAQKIQQCVLARFGIAIEAEVNVIQ
ncbi:UDP-N-acetylmuramate dehydrogenase [Sungkyunkwania multivorans]|uniref:UDP-N-acetylenolpyruvoylglucosamine reductase n=1 Tax=Sungkyunkwania multivorans TaxID=1173618 RepID=A0ABW3D1B3_9FLAO